MVLLLAHCTKIPAVFSWLSKRALQPGMSDCLSMHWLFSGRSMTVFLTIVHQVLLLSLLTPLLLISSATLLVPARLPRKQRPLMRWFWTYATSCCVDNCIQPRVISLLLVMIPFLRLLVQPFRNTSWSMVIVNPHKRQPAKRMLPRSKIDRRPTGALLQGEKGGWKSMR